LQTQSGRPQTADEYQVKNGLSKKWTEPLQANLSQTELAQVNDKFPFYFDEQQFTMPSKGSVRVGQRLQKDNKTLEKFHEKESWAGIAKINVELLDPNSAIGRLIFNGTMD